MGIKMDTIPTFRPYGTRKILDIVLCYPCFVPTGLGKSLASRYATHISPLAGYGSYISLQVEFKIVHLSTNPRPLEGEYIVDWLKMLPFYTIVLFQATRKCTPLSGVGGSEVFVKRSISTTN